MCNKQKTHNSGPRTCYDCWRLADDEMISMQATVIDSSMSIPPCGNGRGWNTFVRLAPKRQAQVQTRVLLIHQSQLTLPELQARSEVKVCFQEASCKDKSQWTCQSYIGLRNNTCPGSSTSYPSQDCTTAKPEAWLSGCIAILEHFVRLSLSLSLSFSKKLRPAKPTKDPKTGHHQIYLYDK